MKRQYIWKDSTIRYTQKYNTQQKRYTLMPLANIGPYENVTWHVLPKKKIWQPQKMLSQKMAHLTKST